MKRFIIAACILVALLGGALYAVYYRGFYLDFGPEPPVAAAFCTQGKQILRPAGDSWQPLEIRGVDVTASLPGEPASDYAAGQETYLRWFWAIHQLGANTLRVPTIMDSAFYDALYRFNTESGASLYLLQGLQVEDTANYGARDAYDYDFRELLIQNGQRAVDVIHGRKVLPTGDASGTGLYRKDVSPWVLGYLVGHEWDSGNIAYTNRSTQHPTSYQGEYFATAPGANRFEALMAEVMDRVTAYETEKYHTQRLIAFINDPGNDPFAYETLYATRFFKYNQVDAQRVVPTEALRSGYFAAYRLSQFNDEFISYFTPQQRAALGDKLLGLDHTGLYHGYLQLLDRYHTLPVVAAGFGYSTARAPIYEGEPPLNEQQQGERIVQLCQEAREAGWAGVFVSTWQDVWERKTWNTSYAILDSVMPVWQDVQTDGQCYGLLEFSLGEEPPCLVDGDPGEWGPEDVVWQSENGSLSMQYDEKYLYFYARWDGFGPQAGPLYIPIDLTPQSGSTYCENYELAFERPCDFVICINGTNLSRVLVQERYETLWAMHAFETDYTDPYEEIRAPDSPTFRPIRLLVQRNDPVPVGSSPDWWIPNPTYETGRLRHGNADPAAADYDSLADFCFAPEGVELRIPWELLNFSDPARMTIHDDYYTHYGVENLSIDQLYVGLADGNEGRRIPLEPFALEGWGRTKEYHERLKRSYYILQDYWAGQAG